MTGAENRDDADITEGEWGLRLYTIVILIMSCVMLIFYSISLYKICKGTRYLFVITLIIMFILSNIGNAGNAIFSHIASDMFQEHVADPTAPYDAD